MMGSFLAHTLAILYKTFALGNTFHIFRDPLLKMALHDTAARMRAFR
jgi:hypothetical protein